MTFLTIFQRFSNTFRRFSKILQTFYEGQTIVSEYFPIFRTFAENFFFFKMCDENELSESHVYYLGELSDAELLQSPTHSESTERKSILLTNEKLHNFLRNQQQANRRSI